MPDVNPNRLSLASQLANRGTVDLEDPRHSVGSSQSARAQRSGSEVSRSDSISGSSFGRSVRDTLPEPGQTNVVEPPKGIESIEKGLEKTTRAQVDVARRSFWGKCVGTTIAVVGLALFAAATGGVGVAAGVALGLMTGFAAKSLGDTALSFMNWRNKKAELLGQPPPYPKLNNMPQAVREDSMAAALVGLGVSDKTARAVSNFTGLALGLSATASYGYWFGGLAGMGLALIPVAAEKGLHAWSHKLEHKREAHTERTAQAMQATSSGTASELAELEKFVLQEMEQQQDSPMSALEIGVFKAELDEVKKAMTQAEQTLLSRVEKKRDKGVSGVSAIALDLVANQASMIPEQLASVHLAPIHVIGASAVALRAGSECFRTQRSMKRDDQKLQQFNATHQQLNDRIQSLRQEMVTRLQELKATDSSSEQAVIVPRMNDDAPPPGVNFA